MRSGGGGYNKREKDQNKQSGLVRERLPRPIVYCQREQRLPKRAQKRGSHYGKEGQENKWRKKKKRKQEKGVQGALRERQRKKL